MAKRFETEKDLENELEVMKIFTSAMSKKTGNEYEFKKLGDNDIDFVIPNVAYVEIKCYNTPFGKYNTQMMNLYKLLSLQKCNLKLPTYFVARYTDCIKYMSFKDMEGIVKWGGRKKVREGSANDLEMLVYLDRSKYKSI